MARADAIHGGARAITSSLDAPCFVVYPYCALLLQTQSTRSTIEMYISEAVCRRGKRIVFRVYAVFLHVVRMLCIQVHTHMCVYVKGVCRRAAKSDTCADLMLASSCIVYRLNVYSVVPFRSGIQH